MTPRYHRQRGFTLVEMLTVVAIIALLISILVPSLNQARRQAKKVKTATLIKSIGDNLEMYNNATGSYPDSTVRQDPVRNWTNGNADDRFLSGAHWLLRALVGHDFQGVDRPGGVMQDGTSAYFDFQKTDPADPETISASRNDVFLEGNVYTRDTDNSKFKGITGDFVPTGRPVIFDDFNQPILYYKASPRAPIPFSDGLGGIYNHQDNAEITGSESLSLAGWDFASASRGGSVIHPLGQLIGSDMEEPASLHTSDGQPQPGTKTFSCYLHDHVAHEAGGVIKPVKPDTFILISPGFDGLYGTDDDVSNFGRAM